MFAVSYFGPERLQAACSAAVACRRGRQRAVAPVATMLAMYQLWLYLHILGAIAAFGFGFYAPIYGKASAAEPQHGNWFLRATKRVSNGVLVPVAISMAVTGTLLVMETGGTDRFRELWLAVALVLYVVALVVVFALQRPTLNKVIAMTSTPPGPEGPPPELGASVQRLQRYGLILLLLILAIVALMVWKPQL
jgi:uncharacterized membrane protein